MVGKPWRLGSELGSPLTCIGVATTRLEIERCAKRKRMIILFNQTNN
jgi:hypothetical protein